VVLRPVSGAGGSSRPLLSGVLTCATTPWNQPSRPRPDGPYRNFRGLLEHLATLPRNQVRFAGATTDEPMLTEPTNAQREAFDLIGVPIPLALK